jgi:hypothetical protein
VIAAALRQTTERLAIELIRPTAVAPKWDEFEWDVARASAAMQGVSSLLAKRLKWRGPARWQNFLETQREQGAVRHAFLVDMVARIDGATRGENVAVIALKGAALHALGIYEPGDRPMGDIDLLARPEDFPAAARALQTLGFHQQFVSRRHAVFASDTAEAPRGFGEHIGNPLKIELHARIAEPLPVTMVDITARVAAGMRAPGVNAYPDRAALLAHLLLHAAGNIRAHALRLLQLEDISRLSVDMTEHDWNVLQRSGGPDGCWWGLPALLLAQRYCVAAIPDPVLAQFAERCPRRLARAVRRYTLTDVSWSNLRIAAFPGIEWSRSPLEALRFAKSRIVPSRVALGELEVVEKAMPALSTIPWYGQRHATRIVRWLFTRPPRVQTMRSVLDALAFARQPADKLSGRQLAVHVQE